MKKEMVTMKSMLVMIVDHRFVVIIIDIIFSSSTVY